MRVPAKLSSSLASGAAEAFEDMMVAPTAANAGTETLPSHWRREIELLSCIKFYIISNG
jgi:hypothetical protein